ncbi:hypothetical protein GSY74_03940, partial [Sulfurovum sp. bin170]|uniref:hypothetical protein n=1 Tax=Sulfurovum sp. bin170 TaxID=2695268 RepID=UPI0013DF74C7
DDGYDTYFGVIDGNGDSWLELVVIEDSLDIQGSTIEVFKNIDSSIFTANFPNLAELSSLKKGTILTISHEATDLSYAPLDENNPDWTINLNANELVTLSGSFETSDRNLGISVSSSDGTILLTKAGEAILGSGIDSREVFKLKKDPAFDIFPDDLAYGDDVGMQVISTFGAANQWIDSSGTTVTQDFTYIKEYSPDINETTPENNSSLVLNEYSAVAPTQLLKDGGYDTYFGTVEGNGGSWFEMMVTRDYLNLQNATITIKESGLEVFSANIPELLTLSYLRKGTIITISDEPTDMTYAPFAPNEADWKLNINKNELTNQIGLFALNDNDISISILNVNGDNMLLSESGEGVKNAVVDNQEVYKLKAEPNLDVTPLSDSYGDDGDTQVISTFGSANQWRDESGEIVAQQLTLRENSDLNETGGIVISNITGLEEFRDGEALLYVSENNSLWMTDDDSHHIYEMDLTTKEIKSVFDDADLGGFTNGDIQATCEDQIGACDIESSAYDAATDTLYIFTGDGPGTAAVFKLTRENINDSFALSDYRKFDVGTEYSATQFIEGDFVVSITDDLYIYNFETNQVDLSNKLLDIPSGRIVGLAYSEGILWVTTSDFELLKVDWQTKEILATYNMRDNGVYDPRGVEIINNELYILEGINQSGGTPIAPIGHALKNAIHIYQLP